MAVVAASVRVLVFCTLLLLLATSCSFQPSSLHRDHHGYIVSHLHRRPCFVNTFPKRGRISAVRNFVFLSHRVHLVSNNIDVWNGDSRTLLRSNVSAGSVNDGEGKGREKDYVIRNAKYSDLRTVVDILIDAFYEPSPMLQPFRVLKELDRLQSNFPYGDENHSMYVVCPKSDPDTAIAFCDLDMRPPRVADAPPRPYLSDLAVEKTWRRRGVAGDLVSWCEREVLRSGKYTTLHLKVESANAAALRMYDQLGYSSVAVVEPSSSSSRTMTSNNKDTTVLLKRDLNVSREQMSMLSASL